MQAEEKRAALELELELMQSEAKAKAEELQAAEEHRALQQAADKSVAEQTRQLVLQVCAKH